MPTEDWERGYDAGYRAALGTARRDIGRDMGRAIEKSKTPKAKRKASAYSRRYGSAFKRIAPKYKNKRGGWKKDGFKRAQKAAHKLARK